MSELATLMTLTIDNTPPVKMTFAPNTVSAMGLPERMNDCVDITGDHVNLYDRLDDSVKNAFVMNGIAEGGKLSKVILRLSRGTASDLFYFSTEKLPRAMLVKENGFYKAECRLRAFVSDINLVYPESTNGVLNIPTGTQYMEICCRISIDPKRGLTVTCPDVFMDMSSIPEYAIEAKIVGVGLELYANNTLLYTENKNNIKFVAPLTELRFEKMYPDVIIPSRQTPGSAGMDVHAYIPESVVIPPGERRLIPTGLKTCFPEWMELQVRSRSGLAHKHGVIVLNAPGTIDSDYPGELGVILYNTSMSPYLVKHNDRIAQLVPAGLLNIPVVEGNREGTTSRTADGFGSTGK